MTESKIPQWALDQRQSLPLDAKVRLAELRIRQWYDRWHGQVHIMTSGGEDSAVLLDIVRSIYPDVPAVFINTGLEFPENVEFIKTLDNVAWIRPKLTFKQVIEKYGYPIPSKEQAQRIFEARTTKSAKLRRIRTDGGRQSVSKKWMFLIDAPFTCCHKCCDALKKRPSNVYERETGRVPYVGTMAADSRLRLQSYRRYGCNVFEAKRKLSRPLSVWTKDDVRRYIIEHGLKTSTIYQLGWKRTGCVFCCFGIMQDDSPNRFQRLKETHPKLWRYCMDKLGMRNVLDYVGVPYE